MGRQRTLMGVMLGAVLVLALGQLLSAAGARTPETVTAKLYGGAAPVWVRGVVIRQETAVAGGTGGGVLRVRDGEKVAAGQILLASGAGPETEALARRVRVLRKGEETAELPLSERRAAIHQAVTALDAAAGADRRTAGEALAGVLLGQTELDPAALETAEEALRRQPVSDGTVHAPEAGVFAAAGDGLEALLTPEDPWAVWTLPGSRDPGTLGRIVTGDVWYFRTELPFDVEPGETLTGCLPWEPEPLTFAVEELRPEGAALLSCGRMLRQVAGVRQIQIKIFPNSKSGLEIPARAVYTVEQQEGVWCLVGEAARFKPVTVIADLGETVVVVALDQSTTDSLWPGDQILLEEQ